MKSWRFSAFGPLKNLQLEEISIPVPAPDECLLKLEYAGLNPADRLLIAGRYPTSGIPPFSVGRDGCGIVCVAPAGGRFKPGDRVVCLNSIVGIERDGTFAEYVAVPEAHLAAIPDWWSPQDGAAGTLVLLTVWQALVDAANLRAGETVVISGASGGVGVAALIVANALGARVIALSRSTEKQQRLRELGASCAFGPEDDELVGRIRELGGADVVIDSVGGAFLAQAMEMTNAYARICVVGALGGKLSSIDATQLIYKRLQVHGIHVGMYAPERAQIAWSRMCDVLAPSRARVPIDRIFPFENVHEAFAHLRMGPMGKVLIGPIGDKGG